MTWESQTLVRFFALGQFFGGKSCSQNREKIAPKFVFPKSPTLKNCNFLLRGAISIIFGFLNSTRQVLSIFTFFIFVAKKSSRTITSKNRFSVHNPKLFRLEIVQVGTESVENYFRVAWKLNGMIVYLTLDRIPEAGSPSREISEGDSWYRAVSEIFLTNRDKSVSF